MTVLIYSPIMSSTSPITKNVIVKPSIRTGVQFKHVFFFFFWTTVIFHPCSFPTNHAFPPSFADYAFAFLVQKGTNPFRDLYIDAAFASFQQPSDKFSLFKQYLFLDIYKSIALLVQPSPSSLIYARRYLLLDFWHQSISKALISFERLNVKYLQPNSPCTSRFIR